MSDRASPMAWLTNRRTRSSRRAAAWGDAIPPASSESTSAGRGCVLRVSVPSASRCSTSTAPGEKRTVPCPFASK
eukprot:scaffold273389_cov29-Tisochrysis_lutea.AAC.7